MLAPRSKFRIFGEQDLREYIARQKSGLSKEVEDESDDYILNVGEEQYIQYLISEYSIENISLEFDEIWASRKEK